MDPANPGPTATSPCPLPAPLDGGAGGALGSGAVPLLAADVTAGSGVGDGRFGTLVPGRTGSMVVGVR